MPRLTSNDKIYRSLYQRRGRYGETQQKLPFVKASVAAAYKALSSSTSVHNVVSSSQSSPVTSRSDHHNPEQYNPPLIGRTPSPVASHDWMHEPQEPIDCDTELPQSPQFYETFAEEDADPVEIPRFAAPLSRPQSPNEADSDVDSIDLAMNDLTVSNTHDGESTTAANNSRPGTAQSQPEVVDPSGGDTMSSACKPFSTAMGIWADAFQVSTTQWKALVEVLRLAPSIEIVHRLPLSISTLKTYHNNLPLAAIQGQSDATSSLSQTVSDVNLFQPKRLILILGSYLPMPRVKAKYTILIRVRSFNGNFLTIRC